MFSLGFTGLFRANELLALRASDIKIAKDHLEVLVRKSKTDRYHQGNTVYIAKTNGPACPHSLLLRFYSLAGIKPLTEAYIFQPISSLTTNGGKKKSNQPIGYSRYREIIKKTLARLAKSPRCLAPTVSDQAEPRPLLNARAIRQIGTDFYDFKADGHGRRALLETHTLKTR